VEDDYPSPDDLDLDKPAAHTPHFKQPKTGKTKKWLIIGSIIAVLGLGGAAYWMLSKDEAPAKQTTNTTTQPKTSQPDLNAPDPNATSKTFKSTKLNVEFNYRSDWTLKETGDQAEVILTSPGVTYTTQDGASAEGVFTLKMRNGVIPDAMQETVLDTVAVKDSEVIGYDQPTEAQRHFTNVSFGGPDANNFGFFIVSGSIAYKAGQVFGSQIDLSGNAYLFAGGYGIDAADALDFEPVAAASFDTEAYQQALAIIKSLRIY
jgi:hypothetical protein